MYQCNRLQHQERMQRKADIVRWERVEQEQLREAAKVKEEYSDRILRSKDELTHVISRAKCRLLQVLLSLCHSWFDHVHIIHVEFRSLLFSCYTTTSNSEHHFIYLSLKSVRNKADLCAVLAGA